MDTVNFIIAIILFFPTPSLETRTASVRLNSTARILLRMVFEPAANETLESTIDSMRYFADDFVRPISSKNGALDFVIEVQQRNADRTAKFLVPGRKNVSDMRKIASDGFDRVYGALSLDVAKQFNLFDERDGVPMVTIHVQETSGDDPKTWLDRVRNATPPKIGDGSAFDVYVEFNRFSSNHTPTFALVRSPLVNVHWELLWAMDVTFELATFETNQVLRNTVTQFLSSCKVTKQDDQCHYIGGVSNDCARNRSFKAIAIDQNFSRFCPASPNFAESCSKEECDRKCDYAKTNLMRSWCNASCGSGRVRKRLEVHRDEMYLYEHCPGLDEVLRTLEPCRGPPCKAVVVGWILITLSFLVLIALATVALSIRLRNKRRKKSDRTADSDEFVPIVKACESPPSSPGAKVDTKRHVGEKPIKEIRIETEIKPK